MRLDREANRTDVEEALRLFYSSTLQTANQTNQSSLFIGGVRPYTQQIKQSILFLETKTPLHSQMDSRKLMEEGVSLGYRYTDLHQAMRIMVCICICICICF